MNAFVYQAAFLCEACGIAKRKELDKQGKRPNDPDDESGYDSDDYPKGPYMDGGGESDSHNHCDYCGEVLDNPVFTDQSEIFDDTSPVEYAALWGCDAQYDRAPNLPGDGAMFYNFSPNDDLEKLDKFLGAIERTIQYVKNHPGRFEPNDAEELQKLHDYVVDLMID